ncbi:hypothetical protein JOF56_003704 [Kibdelosporangium banguiense]|uniref:AP2-like integrase N-terminal domain-containing protein n=1 Tax=Kibdelosporangium banguiense TaxID=1365924 RepID=A0ABS4TH46_9PSEU|nr:hypothetical protein [Kibdelosporangium banguiense]MBP2323319.1 hypothetical protein [Kibdelosporangium banguiense]
MSRYARQYEGDVLYRVVIRIFDESGHVVRKTYLGPYDTPGKAKARLTGAIRHRDPSRVVGRVEEARPDWIPIQT